MGTEMLSNIEESIVARIKTKLATAAGHVEVQRGIQGIPQPAVYVSIDEADFKRTAMETFGQEMFIYIDIVFSHLQNEDQRRKGVYLILEGIIQTLILQNLGLAIKPLEPKSFRNTTTEEQREKGIIVYSLVMKTKIEISRVDDEAVTDLLRVGLNYYLAGNDTDTPDASDIVTLNA